MGAKLDRHVHPPGIMNMTGIDRSEGATEADAGGAALHVFVRFHARGGCERDVERAILKVLDPSRGEPGCRAIRAFRAIGDDRLFYIHSIWTDHAAFDLHAGLSHTVTFIREVSAFLDHPLQAIRTRPLT